MVAPVVEVRPAGGDPWIAVFDGVEGYAVPPALHRAVIALPDGWTFCVREGGGVMVRANDSAIRLSERRDRVRLEARWAARPAEITQAILDTRPAVVHFSGHGSDTAELAFEGDDGGVRVIEPADLVGLSER